jgi:Methyltransferase domain
MDRAQPCPLCSSSETDVYFSEPARDYYQCCVCRLVFVSTPFLLSPDQEKAVYDQHQNSSEDEAYRAFLNRLYEPVNDKLSSDSYGLDFGSGPGPTLSVMFSEAGHDMELYDYFYEDNPTVFDNQYDFITATEVLEHLYAPGRELERLWECLEPGGLLGIMTKRVRNRDVFAGWHYKNDPTHVCFYSRHTFDWLAGKWEAEVRYPAGDVVIFRKPYK